MHTIKLILILIAANASLANARNIDIDKELSALDSIEAQKDKYIRQKQKAIDDIKHEYAQCNTPIDQYNYNRRLYDEYLKFDSDSASAYAYRCRKTAANAGLETERLLSEIDLIYLTILQGELFKGKEMINKFEDIERIPEIIKPKLALAHMELDLRLARQDVTNQGYTKPSKETLDEYDKYKKYLPENGWQYCYYKAVIAGTCTREEIQRHLKSAHEPSVQAAMLYIAMAKRYKEEGNEEMYCHYLIKSAANDIKSANSEASSIIQQIYTPFIDRGSRRASRYVALCMENAEHYRDKYRSLDIMKANAFITRGYEKRLEKNGHIMMAVIIMLIVSVAVTFAALWMMAKKKKRLASTGMQLKNANASLLSEMKKTVAMQEEIERSNKSLTAEIENRNRNFINIYMLLSQYITDMTEYKKTVFNLITAGKVEKARKTLGSNAEMENYLKGFYRHFDKAFLVSHPDFIDRFNAILKPECRITLPGKDTLTPELRIYALVSIGITDSISIAQFMHYSTQTIYNYRLKMRHNACIPETSFAETVYKFYNKDDGKESKIDTKRL